MPSFSGGVWVFARLRLVSFLHRAAGWREHWTAFCLFRGMFRRSGVTSFVLASFLYMP